MHIRPANSEDAPILAAIATAAKASWGYSPAQLEAWRDELSPTAASILTLPTFVAQIADEAAGFCQLSAGGEPITLEHLWVRPARMRLGVGRALLAHAAHHLAASGLACLHIDSDPHAEAFYIACGAVRLGQVAAPLEGDRHRFRPQLQLRLELLRS